MTAPDDRSNYERMLAGDWYLADDPEIVACAEQGRSRLETFNATDGIIERRAVLVELLGSVGEAATITDPFFCELGTFISVGARFFANTGLVALDLAPIRIGDDVQLGPNVQLLTPTHPLDPELRRAGWEAAHPIVIESNVWIGGGAIVLGGLTIGADSVVGAGAVVTHDVPAGVVVVGNPARVLDRSKAHMSDQSGRWGH